MTEPGDTVFVIVTESRNSTPSIGVFASSEGAGRYINSEIDRMKPCYLGTLKSPDPGPDGVFDRQMWWNYEMATTHGNRAFISYRTEIVED